MYVYYILFEIPATTLTRDYEGLKSLQRLLEMAAEKWGSGRGKAVWGGQNRSVASWLRRP